MAISTSNRWDKRYAIDEIKSEVKIEKITHLI